MKNFMRYITAGCIAFTFSCVFALLFNYWGLFPPVDGPLIIGMLSISSAIMILVYFTHFLSIENGLIVRMIEFVSVLAVLLIAGSVFDFFPFTFYYTSFSLLIGILTYTAVTIVIFVGDQTSAKQINQVIRKRRMEESNE